MLIKRRRFPITAPPVKGPPSRKAWNPTILNVNGKSRRAPRASLRVQTEKMIAANVIASMYIMYLEAMRICIKWNAVSFVYMSAVGSGKKPSIPKIGMISNRVRITFMIVLNVFI